MSRESYIKNKMTDHDRKELAKKLNLYFFPDYQVRDHPLNPKYNERNLKMKQSVKKILENEENYGDDWYEKEHMHDHYRLDDKQTDVLAKILTSKDPDFVRSILRKKKTIKSKSNRKPVKKCSCRKK